MAGIARRRTRRGLMDRLLSQIRHTHMARFDIGFVKSS
jgi:hypothetical protein